MLCSEVRNYISTVKGLPFFYLVGDNDYCSALEELNQAGLFIVRMSDFCPKEDRFPSIDELVDYFRTSDVDYRENKYVVVGLGEYLAMRGPAIADKELRRLKSTTLGNARAVLLLRGVSPQMIRIINEDNRLVEQQRVYISENPTTNISITNIMPGASIASYKGIKAILETLEEGTSSHIYASSSLSFDDSIIPISKISDAFSVFKLVSGISHLESKLGSEKQWDQLLGDLSKCKNKIPEVFEKHSIDDRIFEDLHYFVSGLEYKNWLVFLYLKLHVDELQNDYLKLVVNETSNYEDLKTNLLVKIVEHSPHEANFKHLYDERKRLLKDFPEEDIAVFVKANELVPEESIYRLTDNTMVERKTIVKWISRYGINEAISYVYPALSDYLKKYIFDCNVLSAELTEYFDAYKKQKVLNKITDEFLSLVEYHAKLFTYTKLPTRDNAIKFIPEKDKAILYWIDALGVEYMSYISTLAKKKGLSIQTDIVRADLPTITSVNRSFYDNWTGGKKHKEDQLDNIKHKEKGGYFFTDDETPIHIPEELEVIEKAINTAAMELGMHHCNSFIIASDHGASRLAVIKKQVVPYDTDTKGEHSGRCCKKYEGCDLPFIVEDNDYIMLSDYGRFRGSRMANVEVHGGASLEEIVVPLITLTLRKHSGVQISVIHPNDITVDRHNGVILRLYISDTETDNISIVIDGKTYRGQAEDDTHYVFELKDIKRAKVKPFIGEVYDSEDLIGSVSFKVKGKAATVKDDFDFGDDF